MGDSAKPWTLPASQGASAHDSAKPWLMPMSIPGSQGDSAQPWDMPGSAGTYNALPPYRDLILATQGLVSYWRLDDAGPTAADSKGSNPGTFAAGATAQVGGLLPDNAAVRLDGTQGKISFGNPALTTDFSIEGWIYILGAGTVGATDYACLLGADGTHRILLRHTTGELLVQMGGGSITTAPGLFSVEQWVHVVYTRTGSTQFLYVNGVQVGTVVTGGASLNAAFFLGSYASVSANYSAYGRIDEVALYNRVLTPQEAADHYTAGSIGASAITGIGAMDVHATNAASPLTIETPDASGQVVEPSVEYIPAGVGGHRWWADITGYTNGNSALENPAIYYSDDGLAFTKAPGVPFPLVGAPGAGNNSDPEIRVGPDGTTLHTLYVEANNPAGTFNLKHSFSTDGGVTWAASVTILTSASETYTGPVMLYDTDNGRWVLWYVDTKNPAAQYVLRRRTCAGTDPRGAWSGATVCTQIGVPASRSLFEAHVQYSGQQIHMVTTFCDKGTGGGNTTLHFGVSNDHGVTWTFNPSPLLDVSGAGGWDSASVYRADFGPPVSGSGHRYSMWYSAKNGAGVWRWGHTFID